MSDSSEEQLRINVDFITSLGFGDLLRSLRISLAVSTYQSGNLFLIGSSEGDSLRVRPAVLDRPMGMFAQGDSLYVGTLYQVHKFNNVLPPGVIHQDSDRLYLPHVTWTTGAMDCHEVAVESGGRVVFVNTLYSCLAAVSSEGSFSPIWRPPDISELAPEDRCHLNGVAIRDGVIRYATAFSRNNTESGWRANKTGTGVVWDVKLNRPAIEGLSMPHSPRWYRQRLWLLDSGSGSLGYVDQSDGTFTKLISLPGYLRGLAFYGPYALIGSSIPRAESNIDDAAVLRSLAEKREDAYCGVFFVNIDSGRVEHAIRMAGDVQEIFDVAVLAGVQAPEAVGFKDERVKFVSRLIPEK